jgi:sec-independent protein translocase protein TatC
MKQSMISHIEELRKRSIIVLIFLIVFFILGFILSDFIILLLKNNLLKSINIIVTTPFEVIIVKLKVALYISIFLSLPIILYQVIKFIKPALTKKEKKLLYSSIFFLILLFFIGLAFAYFILLKIGIIYLAKLSSNISTTNLWTLTAIINFIMLSLLVLGLIFELPLILIVLSRLNIINYALMKKKRIYIYVLIFVFAAILTPPDPLTQILIAFPLIVLYEISLLVIKFL